MRRPLNLWIRLAISLVIIVALGWLIGRQVPVLTSTNPRAPRPNFSWGASIIPYPTGPHEPATLAQVMQTARDLGLRVVRTEIPPGLTTNEAKFAYLDPIVTAAERAHLDLDLIIHWKWAGEEEDVFSQPNLDQLAYDRARAVAHRYRGRVRYYQLGNEIPTVALKSSWSGATTDAYELDRYQQALAWLKASNRGVHDGDSRATTMTTANWLQYGFFERAFADGLDTNILGWDWFDEEHDIHNLEESGQRVDLIEKLTAFGKPIWFVEAGYSASTHTEAEQADLDYAFLKELSDNPAISGALVGVLIDQIHLRNSPGAHDGIVALDLADPSVDRIGQPKPAYHRIQQLIDEVSGRPKR